MVESAVFSFNHPILPSFNTCPPFLYSHTSHIPKFKTLNNVTKSFRIRAVVMGSFSLTKDQTVGARSADNCGGKHKAGRPKRVFFLDVNPLCYKGSTPSLRAFAHWVSLFFAQVSVSDPVIAVIDGERGNEYRRQILPSYKANRRKFVQPLSALQTCGKSSTGKHQLITDVLRNCNVPVVRIESHEADDVVATLVGQVLERGYRVVIASPDKDFKQLISEDVQIVMPIPELDRWSFYTLKHYVAQYNCDPHSDLSLRCIMGDEVDGVPGIQQMVPGFGRKTAIKLLKKHGSLENLLSVAAVRTIGKPYAQEALLNYADYLRKNYEVLALRRDVNVHLQEEWLSHRDVNNDEKSLANFIELLGETTWNMSRQSRSSCNE
ncbi:hypothetical protein DCAR_0622917 [Daucus carota subsp. sativus]|uniref:5'-3' exonuclease domain-containing protein n=2 Tax=Daucus carota subsp. sativus TaxID=79200 RepID=A0AAF1B3Q1_DAUCS|nr:hypothetical protein DCAR_0622917 [Daucus carota subsp. sativus]